MSLIRYSSDDSRSIVLRHQQTLVLYDRNSHQIILREAAPSSPAVKDPNASCPLCKRPMHNHHGDEPTTDPLGSGIPHRSRSTTPIAESGFVDQQYFRMLKASTTRGADIHSSSRLPESRLDPLESGDEFSEAEYARSNQQDTGIKSSAFSPGYFERFFVQEKELGRGGKGVVLLVRHVLDGVSLGQFACKRVPVGNNHEWLEKVLIEVQLLQSLSHANLVSYRHVWLEDTKITSFGPKVPCAFILQQYCNSGDLHNYVLGPMKVPTLEQRKAQLRRNRGQPAPPTFEARRLPFEQIISFFRDIAEGLQCLHSNGFIHRDLKPQNCLLHDSGIPGDQLRVLVSDFGEMQAKNETRKSTGSTGTIAYCAPEVLRRVSPGGVYENFTTKSDIFSLGMILHFMSFGKLPYAGADQINEENEDLDALREEISAWKGLNEEDKIRTDLPERLYHSLKTLINPDPNVRPSAEDILKGIEMGIGEESPSPLRRGSAMLQQNAADMDESQRLGFRRISPIADSPRSLTPPDTSYIDSKLHADYRPTRNGASTTSERWKATQPGTTKPVSKLNQSSQPPATPPLVPNVGGMSESSLMLIPHAGHLATSERLLVGHNSLSNRLLGQDYMIAKIVVFFIKLVTLTQPCMPAAARSSIYYPMLLLATIDFMAPQLTLTAVLLLAHFVLLAIIHMYVGLCSVL
ncbi:Similar to Probable serine/threonine-protein kinase iksA; acc. no. Q54RJ4 [Pyronema omphalodes CBS 100304]|uniref:non-specific serine/threonine protein kinase n=1 Tax=Pyronema omphalodes (strain CBS 100304) TaxID=1076935 RepID=U4LHS8_PYROM|nr:Similar to Probable serine/threonine-protein kinase iksA; acc. no. Q54RJ4 [Pyronema omphalodes CBS 100304]